MQFEPRAIVFHFATMSFIGGSPLVFESASPELEGSFRTDDGAHGTVAVPLTIDERAFLKEIVESATARAIALAPDVASSR